MSSPCLALSLNPSAAAPTLSTRSGSRASRAPPRIQVRGAMGVPGPASLVPQLQSCTDGSHREGCVCSPGTSRTVPGSWQGLTGSASHKSPGCHSRVDKAAHVCSRLHPPPQPRSCSSGYVQRALFPEGVSQCLPSAGTAYKAGFYTVRE